MPYKIVKVEGGYKVGLRDGGKMSNLAQKTAVEMKESLRHR